ncbi:hypothetical protein [Neptunicella marina]|uniref:PEP-CTERM sorting domain-containing protein n=1 Tax=Neptunicella marina TaxID=2125989 RepID=A0A8J6IWY8_9ALTE|nr:hypothetical protein [Neptunicella marina]MBC3766893.1 hypothetical protein [Neptunicella marina]
MQKLMSKIFTGSICLTSMLFNGYATAGLSSSVSFYKQDGTNACGFSYNNPTASCAGTFYYQDSATGLYTVVSAAGDSTVTNQSLKSKSSLNQQGGLTYQDVLVRILEQEGYTQEDIDYFVNEMQADPYVFEEEVGFNPATYLQDNLSIDPNELRISARASLSDTWLIEGGDLGTTGTLSVFYAIDGNIQNHIFENDLGSISGVSNSTSSIEFYNTITYQNSQGTTITTRGETDSQSFLDAGPHDTLVQLDLNFVFGEPLDVVLALRTSSYINYHEVENGNNIGLKPREDDFLVFADFFNTANLSDVKVKDSSGSDINFQLSSSEDLQVFEDFSSPVNQPPSVPEPDSIFLFGLMLLLGGKCRKHLTL